MGQSPITVCSSNFCTDLLSTDSHSLRHHHRHSRAEISRKHQIQSSATSIVTITTTTTKTQSSNLRYYNLLFTSKAKAVNLQVDGLKVLSRTTLFLALPHPLCRQHTLIAITITIPMCPKCHHSSLITCFPSTLTAG